jgi:hypothetical protein
LSVTEIANPFGFEDFMSGVSCASTISCVAVGYVQNDDGRVPILAHWNGKTWSVAKEAPEAPLPFPSAVSCVSNTSCLAVGNQLAERWNGKTWVKVASPGKTVDGVSCVSITNCLAVGGPNAEQWNGMAWSKITGPNPTGSLLGVSCKSTSCVAVGSYTALNSVNTLVEQSH